MRPPLPSKSRLILLACLAVPAVVAQQVEVVPVQSQSADRTILLPGEILPYQRVTLHARANGYVDRVLVDRGSNVQQGELLVSIVAPEVAAQVAEAESRYQTLESNRAEAEARLAGAQATYDRLKTASATPGAIAGNELVQAEKLVDAARAAVQAAEAAGKASKAALQAAKQSENYLKVTAPFSGVITERFVHPGALVGPASGAAGALLELEQVARLRLVVALPEAQVGAIQRGGRVQFRVPAYPGRTFSGTIARIDRSLDPKTRTMPVELEVANPRQELAPGMFPEVSWPVRGSATALLVPSTAVVTTTERTFVVRVSDGRAEWVNVKKGTSNGDIVEVLGPLSPGDLVVRRANDEIRQGTPLQVRKAGGTPAA